MRTDTLLVATAGYLLLPNVAFAVGWLQPYWSAVVVVAAVTSLAAVARDAGPGSPPLGRATWTVVILVAAFWVVAGGIGELNAQMSDYTKHNLVFHDLAVERWPVVYRAGDLGNPMLCYYIAYYLPAGLAAKLLGLKFAAVASLLWGAVGVTLAFAWVARLGRPAGAAVLVLFTLVDDLSWLPGLSVLVRHFTAGSPAPTGGWWQTDGFTDRFWHLGGLQTRLGFAPETLHLAWTPQHALAAWLGAACALSATWERPQRGLVPLVNAALVLWSPLVAIGLAPLTVAALLRRPRRPPSWVDAVGAPAVAAAPCCYFLAHDPQHAFGLLFTALPGAAAWAKYLLFLLLVVGAPVLAVALAQRRHAPLAPEGWRTFALAGATLVAATFVHMGKVNDWVMRVSMPSLFVLHLTLAAVAVALWRARAPLAHRLAFAALLLLGAQRTLKAYVLIPLGRMGGQGIETTIATAGRNGDALVRLGSDADRTIASQYLGTTDSFFGRHLMRGPRAARAEPAGGGIAPGRAP